MQWIWLVTQLVERSFPTSEVRGSNAVSSELLFIYSQSTNCIKKTKINKKETGYCPFGHTVTKNKK